MTKYIILDAITHGQFIKNTLLPVNDKVYEINIIIALYQINIISL